MNWPEASTAATYSRARTGLDPRFGSRESTYTWEAIVISSQNVEILRDGFEWFRLKGTFPAHLATDDFIWDMSHYYGWPELQVYEGVQGAERFFAEWRSAWDGWEVEIEELHDVGDRVVAIVHQRGRSKMSGMLVEGSMGQVWTFRDGKETRMDMYSDPREALEAVGLEHR